MIEAAAALLQRGGIEAASFTAVVESSGAARGAIYHHFPQGKQELTREAVTWTGQRVRRNIAATEGTEPAGVVEQFLDRIRGVVADASVGRSCAVAAVVVEAGQRDVELTAAAADALQSWVQALQDRLVELGASLLSARQAATLLIVFLEGTQVLCRAAGDLTPFDNARAAIERSVTQLLVAAAH